MPAIRSLYLASRIRRRDELNAYRIELEAAGIEVTSTWLTKPTPENWDDNVWAAALALLTQPSLTLG